MKKFLKDFSDDKFKGFFLEIFEQISMKQFPEEFLLEFSRKSIRMIEIIIIMNLRISSEFLKDLLEG